MAGIDDFVASTRINRYEQAVHAADFSIVQKLAAALNAPTAFFYCEDDELAALILFYFRATTKVKKELLKISKGEVKYADGLSLHRSSFILFNL